MVAKCIAFAGFVQINLQVIFFSCPNFGRGKITQMKNTGVILQFAKHSIIVFIYVVHLIIFRRMLWKKSYQLLLYNSHWYRIWKPVSAHFFWPIVWLYQFAADTHAENNKLDTLYEFSRISESHLDNVCLALESHQCAQKYFSKDFKECIGLCSDQKMTVQSLSHQYQKLALKCHFFCLALLDLSFLLCSRIVRNYSCNS